MGIKFKLVSIYYYYIILYYLNVRARANMIYRSATGFLLIILC